MARHLNCNPSFDDMEFYEFISKYEMLKDKLKKFKNDNLVDFVQGFKNFLGNNG